MTRTIQLCSCVYLSEAGKDQTANKLETSDNARLLLSIFDSLNGLLEKLNRLDYLLQRKNIELVLSPDH